MNKTRLEAFSDAVLAIIITIMVLEMRVPHGTTLSSLRPMIPIFLSYVMSFIYLGIYWNNHHHMLQAVTQVTGATLWANLHLLFWLSLFPFVTSWMGENDFPPFPVGLYGVVLFAAAMAYYILERTLIAAQGKQSTLAKAVGPDFKAMLSLVLIALGIALALWWPTVSCILYAIVALMWLIPDRRIERKLTNS